MAIVRWDPFQDFLNVQNEVGRMFEKTFGLGGSARTADSSWIPAVDAYETDDNFIVKAELPGINPDDIEITLTEGTLVIKGERNFSEEVKEEDYFRMERRYGSFKRTIPLHSAVKQDKVSATFKNGVLEVKVPKMEEAAPKEVKIKVERTK